MASLRAMARCDTSMDLVYRAFVPANLNILNRRMWTRMSGSVGGSRGVILPYSPSRFPKTRSYGPVGGLYGFGTSGLFVISAKLIGQHITSPYVVVALPRYGPFG